METALHSLDQAVRDLSRVDLGELGPSELGVLAVRVGRHIDKMKMLHARIVVEADRAQSWRESGAATPAAPHTHAPAQLCVAIFRPMCRRPTGPPSCSPVDPAPPSDRRAADLLDRRRARRSTRRHRSTDVPPTYWTAVVLTGRPGSPVPPAVGAR